MKPGALGCAVAATFLTLAAAPGRVDGVQDPGPPGSFASLRRWVALVSSHLPGERDEAADAASRLTNEALGSVLAELQEARTLLDQARAGRSGPQGRLTTADGLPTSAAELAASLGVPKAVLDQFLTDPSPAGRRNLDEDLGRLLGRAALLHADAAIVVPAMLRLLRDDDPDLRATLRVTDGRAEGVERGAESHVTLHLRFGNRLMELASVRAPDRTALEAWYRGVAVAQLHYEMYGDATRHLEDARRILPDDPWVLFYSGMLHEVFASPRTQSVIESLDLPPGMMHELSDAPNELRRAERFYRASLARDAGILPAAVRHGRVLVQLGAPREARAVLERVQSRLDDRATRYFAALFLGDALAALGDRTAADRQYAQAASLFPRAETPAILRSALARSAGDRERAVTLLAATLGQPVDPTAVVDPWRTYGTAHVADVEARLDHLRRVLSGRGTR